MGAFANLLKGFCVVWIWCALGGTAQVCATEDVAHAWTTFRQEDGLAHNVVTSITQNPRW